MNILVTGGAGFIGSHLVDRLVNEGYEVTILDNLSSTKTEPSYLNKKAKFIKGDIKDSRLLNKLVGKFDVIFHNAASVGIVQSNYEVSEFVDNNSLGTAKLLQAIIDSKKKPKLIISSSNTCYGEGLYSCDRCGEFHPEIRSSENIERQGFDPLCPVCNGSGKPIPTPENTPLNCNSVYALTKKNQEECSIFLGKLYGFPVTILRYFNVCGSRQSLSNPYTGVSAIFMSRIKEGNTPVIYEDGLQTRDFVSVHDVVEANILAIGNNANYEIFNVGSGTPVSIKEVAEEIYKVSNKEPKMKIAGKFRKGDIRHCISDNSKIRKILGWEPKINFKDMVQEVYKWSLSEKSEDKFSQASRELNERGLV